MHATESVPESLRRGRRCRQANSGYSQGIFMRRHRVAKRAGGGGGGGAEDFVTLFDFSGTSEVSLYNRTFRLVTCSAFTEKVRRCSDAKARTSPREGIAPPRRGSAPCAARGGPQPCACSGGVSALTPAPAFVRSSSK
jgi:hypothetical protein